MHIRISLPQQTLELYDARSNLVAEYLVSTAKNGAGEQNGSFCTPRGKHIIRAKIGGRPAAKVGAGETAAEGAVAAAGWRRNSPIATGF